MSAALAALLRAADPVPGGYARLDERARADLEQILSTARPAAPRRPRSRPGWQAALAAAVVGAALLAVVGVPSGLLPAGAPAFAATPAPLRPAGAGALAASGLSAPSGPADALRQIADRVENLPDDVGSGPYARMSTQGWALWTRVDGHRVTSEVVPTTQTVWTAADGSGRSISTTRGDRDRETYGPGQRSSYWRLGSLSADPDQLAAQLEQGHPRSNGPAERLVAVTDLYRDQPLVPAVRAAVLRYLARTRGLGLTGMVVDRAGRTGLAVHLDSDHGGLPNRRTLVFDVGSGTLLDDEQTLTTTAGALNVAIPSVISYTVHRDARFVPDLR